MASFRLALLAFAGGVTTLLGLSGLALESAAHTTNLTMLDSGAVFTPQSLAEYEAKLDLIRDADGPVLALVGDSFMVGENLASDLGQDWRSGTLDRGLEQCLREQTGQTVYVLNFGMDGLLPLDAQILIPSIIQAGAKHVLLNVNTRSMSEDFNGDTAISRSWISTVEGYGGVPSLGHSNLLKQRFWDTNPRSWGRQVAMKAGRLVGLKSDQDTGANRGILMLRLKSRYRTASYEPTSSEQADALGSLAVNKEVLLFDTVEDVTIFKNIVRPAQQEALNLSRSALLAAANRLDVPDDLVPDDYADLIHVRPSGYAKYVATLCPSLSQLEWSD